MPKDKKQTKDTMKPGKGMQRRRGKGPRDGSGPNPNCPMKKKGKK